MRKKHITKFRGAQIKVPCPHCGVESFTNATMGLMEHDGSPLHTGHSIVICTGIRDIDGCDKEFLVRWRYVPHIEVLKMESSYLSHALKDGAVS